jgi:hypothetical protein
MLDDLSKMTLSDFFLLAFHVVLPLSLGCLAVLWLFGRL